MVSKTMCKRFTNGKTPRTDSPLKQKEVDIERMTPNDVASLGQQKQITQPFSGKCWRSIECGENRKRTKCEKRAFPGLPRKPAMLSSTS